MRIKKKKMNNYNKHKNKKREVRGKANQMLKIIQTLMKNLNKTKKKTICKIKMKNRKKITHQIKLKILQ